ncbi:hypothetical protein OnM2_039080 [Erysiphe neolycopersici]|uniref:Uncharacterized protein n=1 Tax=Erysiphe neolycopersici TaxID=212602 RepID=A0A420HW82_9PEZI|nr:hypothetical protein OnM2_039080 [Erysiphe neolycopersici]
MSHSVKLPRTSLIPLPSFGTSLLSLRSDPPTSLKNCFKPSDSQYGSTILLRRSFSVPVIRYHLLEKDQPTPVPQSSSLTKVTEEDFDDERRNYFTRENFDSEYSKALDGAIERHRDLGLEKDALGLTFTIGKVLQQLARGDARTRNMPSL